MKKGILSDGSAVTLEPLVLQRYHQSDDWRTFNFLFTFAMRYPVRRAFWTANDLLGLGPACMRKDDVVVLLYGSTIPHLLRPQKVEGEYLYLGPAWIEDLRVGKLAELMRTESFEEADFCLI